MPPVTDIAAIRERLRNAGGREYWRSPRGTRRDRGIPGFRPPRVSERGRSVAGADLPARLPEAHGSLAWPVAFFAAGCRKPLEAIVPYNVAPEDAIPNPASPCTSPSALLVLGLRARRARGESPGTADEDRGQSVSSRQPRRDRYLHAGGDPRILRSGPFAGRDLRRRRLHVGTVRGRTGLGRGTASREEGEEPAHPERGHDVPDARSAVRATARSRFPAARGTNTSPRAATACGRRARSPSARRPTSGTASTAPTSSSPSIAIFSSGCPVPCDMRATSRRDARLGT